MFNRIITSVSAAWLLLTLAAPVALAQSLSAGTAPPANEAGIVTVKSAYSMPETIERLKKDIADKGHRRQATRGTRLAGQGAGVPG